MIHVEITADNFVIGMRSVPKGEVIHVAPPIARWIVKENTGKIVGMDDDKPAVKKKAVTKKKATYKTRDMKAE